MSVPSHAWILTCRVFPSNHECHIACDASTGFTVSSMSLIMGTECSQYSTGSATATRILTLPVLHFLTCDCSHFKFPRHTYSRVVATPIEGNPRFEEAKFRCSVFGCRSTLMVSSTKDFNLCCGQYSSQHAYLHGIPFFCTIPIVSFRFSP